MPINVNFLGKYPDWFSFFIILALAAVLSIGARESSFLNNIFTSVNMLTIIIVIVAGAIKGTYNYLILKKKFTFFKKSSFKKSCNPNVKNQ